MGCMDDPFWAKVADGQDDECWVWSGHRSPKGYGMTKVGRRSQGAHRRAWELVNGPIPDGLTVDHACRNTGCCNPRHLRLMTRSENSKGNGNAHKTHCPQGHEYTLENTITRPTKHGVNRVCKECRRIKARRDASTPERKAYMAEYHRKRHVPKPRQERTHCSRGHELTPENTMLEQGRKRCKECNRTRARLTYQRRKTIQ